MGPQLRLRRERSVEVKLTVCSSHETLRNSVIPPPEWAKDEGKFGANALTLEFLQGDPGEKDVQKRIAGIEKILSGKFGRKAQMAELRTWLSTVRQRGLMPAATRCAHPEVNSFVQDVSQWGYGRTITVAVRGSRAEGYHREIST